MARYYSRFYPHKSTYERKTESKNGREVVKPIDRDDFEEMARLCLVKRDSFKKGTNGYFRWYRNYIILILGVNTGCRINTLLEQIPRDYSGGRVTVTEHKTGKRQQYILSPEVYQILEGYIEEFGFTKYEFLFPKDLKSKDSIGRITAWRWIKKLAKEAGIKYEVGCHSLRKSYGRWIWDETHDLLLVQKLLQHTSAEETQRYICLEENDVNEFRGKIKHLGRF